jgi:peptidoglycan/LPS O-acetylase OafA/YrhL
MSTTHSARLSQLDAIRGIAALMVVLFHYSVRYQDFLGADYHVSYAFKWGWLGVHFFFMVSGFVIFMTLCRTATGADFIVSRFSRLFPAYWLAVLLTALFDNLLGPAQSQRSPMEVAVNLTMLQEFVHVRHVDGVYWTLTCELIFYGWMFLFYKFRLLQRIHLVIAIWLAMSASAYLCLQYFGHFPERVTRYFLLEYAYLFSSGILFYEIYTRRATATTYALLGLCLLDAALAHGIGQDFAFILLFFGAFLLVALGKAGFLNFKVLTFFGTISYSLYLLHENLGYILLGFLHQRGMNADLAIVVTGVMAIGLAAFATFLVERPAMNAIRRLYQARIAKRLVPAS